MSLVAKVYDRTYQNLLATLTLADDIGCQPPLRGTGAGGLTLPLTATDPADVAALASQQGAVAFRHIVRFEDDGVPVFAMVIRDREVNRVDSGEEAMAGTDVDGPGILSLWSKAVWFPEGGIGTYSSFAEERNLNFASPYYDDTWWGNAVQDEQGTGDVGGPRAGYPKNLPAEAETAWWIWSQAKNGAGSMPAGDAYFRKRYTSPGELVRIFVTADNSHELYLDGERINVDSVYAAGGIGWAGLKSIDRYLTPGQHLFAFKGTNVAGVDPNPAAVFLAVVRLVDTGTVLGTTVLVTDNTWKALGYPATVPGLTIGHQIRIFKEEAQNRGALAGWALSFTDDEDSDGNVWAEAASSYRIGLDGLSFLAQLSEAYADISPSWDSLTLNAWVKGTKGGPSGLTLTPGVNVARMVNQANG